MDKPLFEITRSFSKKVVTKQYESEDYFCSAKESFYEMPSEEEKKKKSAELDLFCCSEVLGSIELAKERIKREDYGNCHRCKGVADLNNENLCKQCATDVSIQGFTFKKENEENKK